MIGGDRRSEAPPFCSRLAESARGSLVAATLGVLLVGCGPSGGILIVDARTDAVPGIEFTVARVDVFEGTDLSTSPRSEDTPAAYDEDWSAGHRVGELADLAPGIYTVRVQLLDSSGTTLLERSVRVDVEANTAITVLLTRSCASVDCPEPTDDAAATTCVAGRCVDPACGLSGMLACAADCATDAECPAGAACAVPRCVEGACLLVGGAEACDASQYCDPAVGCRSQPGVGADGPVVFDAPMVSLSTYRSPGRFYADGVSYPVTAILANTLTLTEPPAGIATGDEVLLINLRGSPSAYQNVGSYERFYVSGTAGNVLMLTADVRKSFGATDGNDDLTGQTIVVQRIPNYSDVTVLAGVTLTANAWDGRMGGIVAFRATGTVTIAGQVSADALGYRSGMGGYGGESFCAPTAAGQCSGGNGATSGEGGAAAGAGAPAGGAGGAGGFATARDCPCAGGFGGYGTAGGGGGGGCSGGCTAGEPGSDGAGLIFGRASGAGGGGGGAGSGGGGGSYGTPDLSRLFFGSADGPTVNAPGGAAGGIVLITADVLTITGSVTSTGSRGAGGSIYLWARTVQNDGLVAGTGSGASGRTAVHGTLTGSGSFDPPHTSI